MEPASERDNLWQRIKEAAPPHRNWSACLEHYADALLDHRFLTREDEVIGDLERIQVDIYYNILDDLIDHYQETGGDALAKSQACIEILTPIKRELDFKNDKLSGSIVVEKLLHRIDRQINNLELYRTLYDYRGRQNVIDVVVLDRGNVRPRTFHSAHHNAIVAYAVLSAHPEWQDAVKPLSIELEEIFGKNVLRQIQNILKKDNQYPYGGTHGTALPILRRAIRLFVRDIVAEFPNGEREARGVLAQRGTGYDWPGLPDEEETQET